MRWRRISVEIAAAGLLAGLLAQGGGAATRTYSSGTLALPLTPGAVVEQPIDVKDRGPVSRLAVSVRLDDTRDGDLTLTLVAPDGGSVLLSRRRGGNGRNFGAKARGCGGTLAVFDPDYGELPVRTRPPFTDTTLTPEQRLSSLYGREASGAWLLRIAVAPGRSAGTLLCWKLDLSRDVPETARAAAGGVSAELSFRERNYAYHGLRLTIERGDIVRFDRPLPAFNCRGCPSQGFLLAEPKSALAVRDLDGDGRPEVLLNLYTGGAHCCSYTLILGQEGGTYRRSTAFWGNAGYRLRDLNGDRRPELVSADDRFAYAFVPYVFSVDPIRIWRWRNGRLLDVTRLFPNVVARDAQGLLELYRHTRKSRPPEVRGILAAYLADQYLLGREGEGWRVLELALRRGELGRGTMDGYPAGASYLAAVRRFLRQNGYA